jgi:hypothetical protein
MHREPRTTERSLAILERYRFQPEDGSSSLVGIVGEMLRMGLRAGHHRRDRARAVSG